MRDLNYRTVVERGRSPLSDAMHDFIVPRISGHWLDVGCNAGWMLSDIPNGVGVEPSLFLVELARAKGLDVRHAWAEELPLSSASFDLAVIAGVLQSIENWRQALSEARRVAKRVIGLVPYPGTPWGIVGGKHPWVRSVIDPAELIKLGATIEHDIAEGVYFFSI